MQEQDEIYLNALRSIPNIGSARLRTLWNYFQSGEAIWRASFSEMRQTDLPEKVIEEIITSRKKIDPEILYQALAQNQIRVISAVEDSYPILLKEIHPSPFLLYTRGCLPEPNQFLISIVGTRNPTNYGKTATRLITHQLVENNIGIVSGLALGIDTMAHQTTLDASAYTIAVLGGGIDNESIYPRANLSLALSILANHGCILSEYPPGTSPNPKFFPQRNRIIAGLSRGTLITGGDINSGSLITAQFALDYNREVFAVPGQITNTYAAGTNELIKKGAHLATAGEDILSEMEFTVLKKIKPRPEENFANSNEKNLFGQLAVEPTHIDSLVQLSKLTPSAIGVALTALEIRGLVENTGAGYYKRII